MRISGADTAPMDLITYRTAYKVSQAAFAKLMKDAGFDTSQGLVSQWESGVVAISAERAIQIEQVTDGVVTRGDLRPDLWPKAAGGLFA